MPETPKPVKYPADPQFVVDQPELLAALAFVVKAVPRRPAVPVMAGVVVTVDDDGVSVAAFDYEQSRRVQLAGAKPAKVGSVLVAASELLDRVKVLPKDKPIAFAGQGAHLLMSNGKTSYAVPTMPREDYPSLPKLPPVVGTVQVHAFAAAAVAVAKHAGRDETLPMMTGVRLTSTSGGALGLEASDRYRLAIRDIEWADQFGEFAALVPGWTLGDVMGTLAKQPDQMLTIRHGGEFEGMLAFETATVQVTTRLLDGTNYPPIRSLVPEHFSREFDADVAELAGTVKRIEPTLDRGTPLMVTVEDGGVTLSGGSVHDKGTGSEAVDGVTVIERPPGYFEQAADKAGREAERTAKLDFKDLPKAERDEAIRKAVAEARGQAVKAGTTLTLGVNPTYLLGAMTSLASKRVRISVVDPFKPLLIVPLDASGEPVKGVTNLVMTIRATSGEPGVVTQATDQALDALASIARKQQPTTPVKAKRVAKATTPGKAQAASVPVVAVEPAKTNVKGAKAKKGKGKPARALPALPLTDEETKSAAEMEQIRAAALSDDALDPNIEHPWRRAVDDGRKPGPMTRCVCGAIRNAKVHGGRQAAAIAAAAEAAASGVQPGPAVPEGPVWMAVLQLASRVGGRMVTEATVQAGEAAVKQFGADKVLAVQVTASEHGKRMYVAVASEADADRMRTTAAAFGIPATTAEGVWPPQGAAAGDNAQEGNTMHEHDDSTPVITSAKFDPAAAARRARDLAVQHDYVAALAVIDDAMQVAPTARFSSPQGAFGWANIRKGILVLQEKFEAGKAAEQAAQAKAEAAAPKAQPVAKTEPAKTEPAKAVEVEPVRPSEPTAVAALRAALVAKGVPDAVIDAAVGATLAALPAAVVAEPVAQAKPAKDKGKGAKAKKGKGAKAKKGKGGKGKPAKAQAPAAVEVEPVAKAEPVVTDAEMWGRIGVAAPVDNGGERMFVLPAGTRLRALRAAVVDGLKAAKTAGRITGTAAVHIDRDERPYKLRIVADNPAALAAIADVIDDVVAEALPQFMPVGAVRA